MKYTVILREENGHFHVKVPYIPDCSAEAKTRQEAITRIQDAIAKYINQSEIITLDVSVTPKSGDLKNETPWELFGKFKHDNSWSELFDKIEEDRNS